jgi:hypothetical protein
MEECVLSVAVTNPVRFPATDLQSVAGFTPPRRRIVVVSSTNQEDA